MRLLLLLLGPLLGWEFSGGDLPLARLLADAGGFPARHAWWAERLLHDGLRGLIGALLAAQLLLWLWAPRWAPPRRELGYGLLGSVLAMGLVSLLKSFSHTSCPYELSEFGGVAPYVPHWLLAVWDGGPGRCFPSGHAAGAFGLLAAVVPWWSHRPGVARGLLVSVLLIGAAASVAQMARGAHYLSHCLWAAWLCALCAWLLARWLEKKRGRAAAAPALAAAELSA